MAKQKTYTYATAARIAREELRDVANSIGIDFDVDSEDLYDVIGAKFKPVRVACGDECAGGHDLFVRRDSAEVIAIILDRLL